MSTRFAITLSADYLTNAFREGSTEPASTCVGGLPDDAKLDRVEYKQGSPTVRLVFKSELSGPAVGCDAEVVQDLTPLLDAGGTIIDPAKILTSGPVSSADPDARAAAEIEELRKAGKVPAAPSEEEMSRRRKAKPNPVTEFIPVDNIVPGAPRPKPAVVVETPTAPVVVNLEEPQAQQPAEAPVLAQTEAEQLAAETGIPLEEIKADLKPKKGKAK
jgi:Ni,Fe-hydrogenase III small subunit